MDECEDNLSAEEVRSEDSLLIVRNKPKKRSLVERELETNLTARVTSPVTAEGASTSRYGRARRFKVGFEMDSEKNMKPLKIDTKPHPQAYKMHASNSPIRKDSPKPVSVPSSIEDQIENIYNENMSLSRFGSEEQPKGQSPAKKFPKIYMRKDLIQKPDTDNVVLIKNLFSPAKGNSHLNNILERSSEKYSLNGHAKAYNGFPDTSSVVKTLDFDGKKKKKEVKEKAVSKNELFDLEASCEYQVGDLAWARVGTYPFWPCIVTREPYTDTFIKKKLFGRVEHDVIHVTFFGDNGRRGWIVDNMLRKYRGRAEFESAREKFTPEAKKKDPRLYAAHFVSEKKLPLWNVSVEEAETLMREPKRLRIDILYDMLEKTRTTKPTAKREKSGKITRTDSDVSLSESLYDTLFSEDDGKADENNRTKNTRNKSLDVSEVVTACLDNMAAKSGITKIQKQSHMDRWLQKAKSKTPEKSQPIFPIKTEGKKRDRTKKRPKESRKSKSRKNESLNSEMNLLPYQNEHDYSSVNYENHDINDSSNIKIDFEESSYNKTLDCSGIGIIEKVESLSSSMDDCNQDDIITTVVSDEMVMTDAESIPKEIKVVDANDNTKVIAKNVEESNQTCIQNSIGSIENERKEIKDKPPPKIEDPKNDSIATRRSKRKRQSAGEKSKSLVQNQAKNAKLDLNGSNTEINTIIANTNTENSDISLGTIKSDLNEQMTDVKEESTIPLNVTNSSIQKINEVNSDEWYRNKLIPLNGPKPVVVIEPLKMVGLGAILSTKAITQLQKDAKLENILTENWDTVLKTDESTVNASVQDLNKVVKALTTIDPSAEYNANDEVTYDVTVDMTDGGTTESQNTEVKNTDDSVAQNEAIFNGNDCTKDDIKSNTMDVVSNEDNVDSNELIIGGKKDQHKFKSQNDNLTELVPPLSTTLPNNKASDTEEAIKTTPEINNSLLKPENKEDTAKVVFGEETYTFDRTLSQDYDEIFEDDNKINGLPVDSENKVNYGCYNSEIHNGDVLSQDYDEIYSQDKDEKDYDLSKIVEKTTDDLSVEAERKQIQDTTNNAVLIQNTFFEEGSAHKDKDKTTSAEDNLLFQLTKDDDRVETDNQENKSSDAEAVKTKTEKTEKFEEGNKIPNKELKNHMEKKLKSPKLSLNRVKKVLTRVDLKLSKTNVSTAQIDSADDNITDNADNTTGDTVYNEEKDLTAPDLVKPVDDITIDSKADVKVNGSVESKESSPERKIKDEFDPETASIKSEDSAVSSTRRKIRKEKQSVKKAMDDPEFMKYLELRQDALIDEQPDLTQDEIVTYLYQTWLYEESTKSDRKKTDDAEQLNLVKGLNQDPAPQPKKIKKKPKVEKESNQDIRDIMPKEKPKRKITQNKPYYNEEFSDLEEEDLETFSIFDTEVKNEAGEPVDEVELYFEKLTQPKPNVFKGFVRERVCEICEQTENLVKCKGCHGMFHVDCVNKAEEIVELTAPTRGRKKKKKPRGRPPKGGYPDSIADSGSQSDERSQDANISEELNESLEEEPESLITIDADVFESQWEKMKEILPDATEDLISDQEILWDAPPGQCEIVDVKQKVKPVDYTDFKCRNCQKCDTPVCFVCKSDKSPKGDADLRQKCQVAHCHRYYHIECLECWPQTQFYSWEPSKTNKKSIEYIEALSCPRHVCHTCVSDDPRGCKTRFCGDKLARCVRCPATYHSFTKCLPAGTQILTASQIICPRHYEHRPGKVPCHVNTGWCFICALGGTLICCEYCPTSFHAECLNIKPPEGSYMCEDCETGRLPLYGEMVWVKLGHYRWWPGIVLHPTEIPDNIMAVKHSPGEFVVRFFGQYDHYWVNRGRVFPFQEGDSGKISSQKSKIDAAFTTAMEHAQRACEILKNVQPNEEEDLDIASSLLPPHYVKLKVNKPVGSLVTRRDVDPNSLTQCDCDPNMPDPCGPYSHCLNRMLLTECGPLCKAGERCNNRALERRSYPRLAAARTAQRGWGLRTLEDIRQGQFVIEYVGELIDEEEFRRRMRRKHEVRDENYYFLTLDKERMIDAGPKGNLARFMNHCCEPNCETQKWTVLGDVRVGLFALRDIPANSELTFNYNLECAGIEKKRCLCGAKRCSGYIGAKPKQEEVQPKKLKLKGPGKRTYKKRKNVEDSPSASTSKIKHPIKTKIKPPKPRELTEIEKDLLIIKNATNGMSSDSDGSRLSVDEKKDTKPLKRKRVSFSTEEANAKKARVDDKVGD